MALIILIERRSFLSSIGVFVFEYLREGSSASSNVIIKEFVRWYCKSRSGRLGLEPNIVSVNDKLKKLYRGFELAIGIEIS